MLKPTPEPNNTNTLVVLTLKELMFGSSLNHVSLTVNRPVEFVYHGRCKADYSVAERSPEDDVSIDIY